MNKGFVIGITSCLTLTGIIIDTPTVAHAEDQASCEEREATCQQKVVNLASSLLACGSQLRACQTEGGPHTGGDSGGGGLTFKKAHEALNFLSTNGTALASGDKARLTQVAMNLMRDEVVTADKKELPEIKKSLTLVQQQAAQAVKDVQRAQSAE